MDGLLRKAAFYALLGLIWEAVSRAGFWPSYLFPSPEAVAGALAGIAQDGTLWIGLKTSVLRILTGYGMSLVLGVGLGALVGRFKILDETVGSVMTGLQVLPSICWLPLAILWFGLSEAAIQFVVVMGALISIAIATDHGIKTISPVYLRAARTMGVRGLPLYFRVIFPAALPSVVTGMKLGWSFAWRSLMAGELIFVSMGLGHLLNMGRELGDMAQVMAVMLVIIAVGLFFDQLVFAPLERRVRRQWGMG